MRRVLLLLIICAFFPSAADWLGDGITSLLPVVKEIMPCLFVLGGLYLVIKSVSK